MSRTAAVFDVFIASPSDAADERDNATAIIHEWNAIHYQESPQGSPEVFLNPVRWESHSFPTLEAAPQTVINKRLLSHADLLVAVFKGRLGRESDRFESNTIEEIEECIQAGIPILLYFNEMPPAPPITGFIPNLTHESREAMQKHRKALADFEQVQRCRKKFEKRGIIGAYRDIAQFRHLLERQLSQAVGRLRAKTANQPPY
jgi:hypothetical protein